MKKTAYSTLLLSSLAFALVCCQPENDQPPRTKFLLTGRTLYHDQPIGGVEVTLDEANLLGTTDEGGLYTVEVAEGQHLLNFRKTFIDQSFSTAEALVDVRMDLTVNDVILLTPAVLSDTLVARDETTNSVRLSWSSFQGEGFESYEVHEFLSSDGDEETSSIIHSTDQPEDTVFLLTLTYLAEKYYRVVSNGSKGITGSNIVKIVADSAPMLYNRIQVYAESTLVHEYFYTDENVLIHENIYYVNNGWEKCGRKHYKLGEQFRYNYEDGMNKVKTVEVYDSVNMLIRTEVHDWADDLNTSTTSWIFPSYIENADIYYDYASSPVKTEDYFNKNEDTVTIHQTYYSSGYYRVSDNSAFGFRYILNTNDNVTDFYFWTDYWLAITYDDHENPFYRFKGTRLAPVRMSRNNIVSIQVYFDQAGDIEGYFPMWLNTIQYEYDSIGQPITATTTYSCGFSDTVHYVYDKVFEIKYIRN